MEDIIKQGNDLFVQGTVEWITARELIIGGSEMEELIKDKGKFSTIIKLYKKKIKLIESPEEVMRQDSLVFLQGHIFEDITKHLILQKYGIRIHNVNGPIMSSCPAIGYSMDGIMEITPRQLATLPIFENRMKHHTIESLSKKDKILTLFECKSAYTRQLVAVPDYECQIYTGLFTFPQIDMCLFTDTCYKICSINQFYSARQYSRHLYDEYNQFHKVIHDPIYYSISFIVTKDESLKMNFEELSLRDSRTVEYVFSNIRDGKAEMVNGAIFGYDGIDPSLHEQYYKYFNTYIASMRKKFEGEGQFMMCYMPWKLYKMHFVLYDRDDDKILPYCDKAVKMMDMVKRYKSTTDEEKSESVNIFRKEFGINDSVV
jgi:hypothetical protein